MTSFIFGLAASWVGVRVDVDFVGRRYHEDTDASQIYIFLFTCGYTQHTLFRRFLCPCLMCIRCMYLALAITLTGMTTRHQLCHEPT